MLYGGVSDHWQTAHLRVLTTPLLTGVSAESLKSSKVSDMAPTVHDNNRRNSIWINQNEEYGGQQHWVQNCRSVA